MGGGGREGKAVRRCVWQALVSSLALSPEPEAYLRGGAAMVFHCMKCVDISGQVSAVGDPRAWKIFSSWFMSLYPRNHT